MLDLKNLSEGQVVILQQIWGVLEYFEGMRRTSLDLRVLDEQAKRLGGLVADFKKASEPRQSH
jgi:hypothetical protein